MMGSERTSVAKAAVPAPKQPAEKVCGAQQSLLAPTHSFLNSPLANPRSTLSDDTRSLWQSGRLQAKLAVSQPDDLYEQEADHVAEQVMRMPALTVQRTCAAGGPTCPTCKKNEDDQELVQRKTAALATSSTDSVPDNFLHSLGPGQPLDSATRAFFEPRFGHDFSRVRVHVDATAGQSVRDVNAHAYTVGHDMVFGAGRFVPGTQAGRRLIAHELTHVVQQSTSRTMLQRAENDTIPNCAPLTDTQSDVDAKVNTSLVAARTTAGIPPAGTAVARGVLNDLGRDTALGRTAIEVWASTLPLTKAVLPNQSATKYTGVTYNLWSQPLFPILNPTMKVNDICVGSDKLGHFFQQGATFQRTEASSGRPAAEEESERSEGGGYGLASTGVFSNADQEANRQGGKFYNDLIAAPTMTFAIARYISSRWSEVDNPNFYEESVGHQVWANTLTGYWTGQSKNPPTSFDEILMLRLSATATGVVSGVFSVGGRNLGNITNGIITYNTRTVRGEAPFTGTKTSPTPISGIHLDFDWTLDTDSGKGFLDSDGERHLTGRWGRGASNTDRGAWDIRHT